MPTTAGPNSPTVAANDASVGSVSWSPGVNNVFASDDVRVSKTVSPLSISQYLMATGFGFAIPAGATILGILVEWERQRTGAGSVTDYSVRLVKGGAIVGTDKADLATNWPGGADAYASYGGPADLWGETWTRDEINAADFGAVLACQSGPGLGSSYAVDHVRVSVTYLTAAEAPPVQVCRVAQQVPHPGYVDE